MIPIHALVATVTVLSHLLGPAAAVDVTLYASSSCGGAAARCTNIGSGVCCHQAPRRWNSSRCAAALPGGILQTVYQPSASNLGCGQETVTGTCQGVCYQNRVTSGVIWNRLSKRSEQGPDDGDGEGCKASVEPDIIQFGGRAFSLNNSAITQEQRDDLWAYFDASVEAEHAEGMTSDRLNIPAEFDAFEVDVQ